MKLHLPNTLFLLATLLVASTAHAAYTTYEEALAASRVNSTKAIMPRLNP